MAKPMLKPDDPEQSRRFIKMAEELKADSSAEQFDRAFAKVATAERQPITKPTKRKKR